MTHWFLKAKHWQLAIIYGLLLSFYPLLYLIFIIGFIREVSNDEIPSFLETAPVWFALPFIALLTYGFLYFRSIGLWMYEQAPKDFSLKPANLKIAITFPYVYYLITTLLIVRFFYSSGNINEVAPYIIIIVLFYGFALVCNFYRIYFMARLFKSVELGREASLEESLLEGVFFWFYIVGFWIMHPKVNEYYYRLNEEEIAMD